MTSKTTAIFRNIGLGFLVLIGIISCENDLEDIAVDLTGQKPFQVGDSIFEIISYHKNIDSSRVDNNDPSRTPLYLLGVNSNFDFGTLESDLISQLGLPLAGVDFGDNPVIDRVVLDIPYFSTRDFSDGLIQLNNRPSVRIVATGVIFEIFVICISSNNTWTSPQQKMRLSRTGSASGGLFLS